MPSLFLLELNLPLNVRPLGREIDFHPFLVEIDFKGEQMKLKLFISFLTILVR